ncbi:MAG: hypothetical protein U1B30_11730 [Pseudomonadota bacterium]|nr:hypothetical protein [Pseudomonadota bacterium]
MVETVHSSKDLKRLEEKREALEAAVKIALNIERLHSTLEAALLLGTPTSELPEDALATLEELEESIKSQPIGKLKQSLKTLERVVQSRLAQILKISEMDAEEFAAPGVEEVEALLNDYRKQAQTSVALRLLLHSRGEATAATELHVPAEQIRARLSVVEQKEHTYREIIKTEIVTMITETDRMLENPGLSPTMRQFLLASNEDMRSNLAHLNAGKKITNMPVAIEIIEMDEREITSFDTTPASNQTNAIPALQKQRLVAPMEHSPMPPKPDSQQVEKKVGLIARFARWISTPDSITWKQIKQDTKKKNKSKNKNK